MADIRIQDLPTAPEAHDADIFPASQDKGGGVLETRKLTVAQVKTHIRAALGSAADADLTTSRTDTTEGRVIKVGDYGLSGESPIRLLVSDDLDDIIVTGFYYNASGGNTPGNNYPVGVQGFLEVVGTSWNASLRAVQIFSDVGTTSQYLRTLRSSGWTPWVRLITDSQADFTVMPNVNGSPIVESGSNANGSWTKWADGTMICTAIISTTAGTMTSNNGGYITDYLEFDIPQVFDSEPVKGVIAYIAVRANLMYPASMSRALDLWGLAFKSITDVSNVDIAINLWAIGRWK